MLKYKAGECVLFYCSYQDQYLKVRILSTKNEFNTPSCYDYLVQVPPQLAGWILNSEYFATYKVSSQFKSAIGTRAFLVTEDRFKSLCLGCKS